MSKLFLKILDTCEFQKKISIITVENWTFQKLQIVNNYRQSQHSKYHRYAISISKHIPLKI
jgi:hypothetical protein